MPPYSRLKEFMVEKYRAIAESEESTTDQKLRALGHLENLQVKRKPRPKHANSGSFKKNDPRIQDNRKAPKPKDSRLLGAVLETPSDLALLGLQAAPDPLEDIGPATGSAELQDVKGVV